MHLGSSTMRIRPLCARLINLVRVTWKDALTDTQDATYGVNKEYKCPVIR